MSITVMSEARPAVAGAQVRGLAGELAGLVGALDADALAGLAGRDAADLTAVFAEIERLAGAGKTLVAGRVAESGHGGLRKRPSHHRAMLRPWPARGSP